MSRQRYRGEWKRLASALALAGALSCGGATAGGPCPNDGNGGADKGPAGEPTIEEAQAFIDNVDKELRRLWTARERAGWVNKNFVTDDTNEIAAETEQAVMDYLAKTIPAATRFDKLKKPADLERKFQLLKIASALPAPKDTTKSAELAKLVSDMGARYSKGKYCPAAGGALRRELAKDKENKEALACEQGKEESGVPLGALTKVLAESRDEAALREAWVGWRTISPPMRKQYERYVELGNEGSREIGFKDLGDLWRSGYDMPAEAFRADVERLWNQVKPFYEEVHCYVRKQLQTHYGKDLVKDKAPIPAHLLGNMWSQNWGNIYPLVEPFKGQATPDVTKALANKKYDEIKMVKTAEGFFTSIGLDPLPESFWKKSLFKKPKDREVECHASAWDVHYNNDLRIKMCIQRTDDELNVIHHELGHNYYYRYYYQLPMLYQSGANDGFHEAIGDAIALSITPGYLEKIGLIEKAPSNDKAELNYLMKMALDKIAFLPFGKLIDQWRWDVFAGKTKPADYNKSWWDLRLKYQGIASPVPRTEADFDPGSKYHVPGNVPYIRYFLAFIYQFQFQRALCREAGHKGPLHKCSIYENKKAGEKLKALLALGASRPWQDALQALSGERQADAGALLEYFEPMRAWLKEQNKGQTCGW